MFCQSQAMIVTSICIFTFAFEYTEKKTVIPFTWHHIFPNYRIARSAISLLHISEDAFNISVTTPEVPEAFLFFILQIDFTTISLVIRGGGPSTGSAVDRASFRQGNSIISSFDDIAQPLMIFGKPDSFLHDLQETPSNKLFFNDFNYIWGR